MEFVSVNRIIAAVGRNLGMSDVNMYADSIIEWSFEAEKFIGGLNSFLKQEDDNYIRL